MSLPIIVWLRRDLRLSDQPAFVEAAAKGAVIPPDDARSNDYPPRLLDHREARERALVAWQKVKSA